MTFKLTSSIIFIMFATPALQSFPIMEFFFLHVCKWTFCKPQNLQRQRRNHMKQRFVKRAPAPTWRCHKLFIQHPSQVFTVFNNAALQTWVTFYSDEKEKKNCWFSELREESQKLVLDFFFPSGKRNWRNLAESHQLDHNLEQKSWTFFALRWDISFGSPPTYLRLRPCEAGKVFP